MSGAQFTTTQTSGLGGSIRQLETEALRVLSIPPTRLRPDAALEEAVTAMGGLHERMQDLLGREFTGYDNWRDLPPGQLKDEILRYLDRLTPEQRRELLASLCQVSEYARLAELLESSHPSDRDKFREELAKKLVALLENDSQANHPLETLRALYDLARVGDIIAPTARSLQFKEELREISKAADAITNALGKIFAESEQADFKYKTPDYVPLSKRTGLAAAADERRVLREIALKYSEKTGELESSLPVPLALLSLSRQVENLRQLESDLQARLTRLDKPAPAVDGAFPVSPAVMRDSLSSDLRVVQIERESAENRLRIWCALAA